MQRCIRTFAVIQSVGDWLRTARLPIYTSKTHNKPIKIKIHWLTKMTCRNAKIQINDECRSRNGVWVWHNRTIYLARWRAHTAIGKQLWHDWQLRTHTNWHGDIHIHSFIQWNICVVYEIRRAENKKKRSGLTLAIASLNVANCWNTQTPYVTICV